MRSWFATVLVMVGLIAAASGCAAPTTGVLADPPGSPVTTSPAAPASVSATPIPPTPTVVPATAVPTTAKPGPVSTMASRLTTLPASTSQVVIVHSAAAGNTTGTLETFTKRSGGWETQFGAMSARLGSAGIAAKGSEGLPATPAGLYSFGATMYGNAANPGVGYAWHKLVSGDYWDENPSSPTYNTFVHGGDPGGASEALWTITPQYNYFAVIAYNMPNPVPGAGSAIFLHVSNGKPTQGCVSMSAADLVKVLTWLDPAKNPRILITVDAQLSRY